MEVSAVKLRNSYQIYYVDTNNLFVNQNSDCIVEIDHGIDMGKVVKSPSFNRKDLKINGKLVRKATEEDLEKIKDLEEIEKKAFTACREKAAAKKLEMKLVAVKCLFDKTKLIFYFVAENRIDFRELVRELAAVFRTRIEMRQIGVRDEARLTGGYGPCGKKMCCLFQRDDFDPVSIKMAKEQNLNLNSMKISGMCGRLLCCLGYEYDTYKELNKKIPQADSEIVINDTVYHVLSVNTLRESIMVRDKDRFLEVHASDLKYSRGKYYLNEKAAYDLFHPDEKENEEDDEY